MSLPDTKPNYTFSLVFIAKDPNTSGFGQTVLVMYSCNTCLVLYMLTLILLSQSSEAVHYLTVVVINSHSYGPGSLQCFRSNNRTNSRTPSCTVIVKTIFSFLFPRLVISQSCVLVAKGKVNTGIQFSTKGIRCLTPNITANYPSNIALYGFLQKYCFSLHTHH